MQEKNKNLKAEQLFIKNAETIVEVDLKRLDEKVSKKKKVKNSTSQTDLVASKKECPSNPKLLSSSLPFCSKTTDFDEDSFNEFDVRAIADDPKSETEPIVIINVKVENMFETLSTEAIDKSSTESTPTSSSSYLLKYTAEQMQILSRQMDQEHVKISEILRK